MTKVLQAARTLVGLCLLAGALAIIRLGSLERGGLTPSVSAAEMRREPRFGLSAFVNATPRMFELSGR